LSAQLLKIRKTSEGKKMKKILMSLVICVFGGTQVLSGGISSGGGNTLPENLVSKENVELLVNRSKLDLILLFKKFQWADGVVSIPENGLPEPGEDFVRLNEIKKKLLKQFYSTQFEVKMEGYCKDSDGNNVDGSVSESKPNAVCISAFSISKKLSKERARGEVLALIAHEVSHLVGADEEDAHEIQEEVLWLLKDTLDDSSAFLVVEAIGKVELFVKSIDNLVYTLDSLRSADIKNKLKAVESELNEFNFIGISLPYEIFSEKEYLYNELHYHKLLFSSWYSEKMGRLEDGGRYDAMFNGNETVSYAQAYKFVTQIEYKNFYKNYKIKKINNRRDLKLELKELSLYYEKLIRKLNKLRH